MWWSPYPRRAVKKSSALYAGESYRGRVCGHRVCPIHGLLENRPRRLHRRGRMSTCYRQKVRPNSRKRDIRAYSVIILVFLVYSAFVCVPHHYGEEVVEVVVTVGEGTS